MVTVRSGTESNRRPKRSYRAAYVTLAVAVVLIVVCGVLWVRSSGLLSYWNGPGDWRGAEVVPTTLEQTGWRKYVQGGAWRDLPFEVSPAEMRDLGQCLHLAARRGVTIDGVNQFPDDSVGEKLQAIVKQRPGFFYGEFILGKWYEARGDKDQAAKWIGQAYADAPVILVQRYAYADGTPAAGLHVSSFAVECNRVKKHSLDPSLELMYWDLVTDQKGCIYVPAYRTVYRADSMGYPDGLPTEYPRLGWFEVRGKVGVLPTAVVKKQ